MAVVVEPRVLEGIDYARETCLCNMYELGQVRRIMEVGGYPEASEWVADNPCDYCTGISEGFETDAETTEES